MDAGLPKEEEDIIKSVLTEHKKQIVGFHALRTRKSGSQRFADLHLVMHRKTSVEEAHNMCDHLENDLKEKLPRLNITIHIEPCEQECPLCVDSVKKTN
jgi:divalent metal cation (Fe/Co/Zn/Cd) transporter